MLYYIKFCLSFQVFPSSSSKSDSSLKEEASFDEKEKNHEKWATD
ncbi:hypothetical protein HMPREF0833_11749 [Streptococcus parasanguinis ATCC 15912]|uniref:Uncharacterized protein n=1 Tax=Streptococcus parasanguinis (strain ATCC 15912 / DSM 6778 / CIP 104372 / LMG 14537) TaxID=760570 RepID=F8DHE9_STREP|nr:hypothetical protein HMPREF0833_11749 [Streptococcus parasanguinis ATCC 15912]